MDIWRYSDWDGFGAEVRESQPHIWHWRDWIVENLNADTGYDRMLVAMLAADEAHPGDPAALRATGFLARNWYKFNRNAWLDNILEHTSKAFLGITMNCAVPRPQIRPHHPNRLLSPACPFRAPRISRRTCSRPIRYDKRRDSLRVRRQARRTDVFVRARQRERAREGQAADSRRASRARRQATCDPTRKLARGRRESGSAAVCESRNGRAGACGSPGKRRRSGESAEIGGCREGAAAARAGLTAAEARVAADLARLANPPRPEADLLARLAATAERQTAYLKADAEFRASTPPRRHRRTSNPRKRRSMPRGPPWRRRTPRTRRSARRTRRPAPGVGWRSRTGSSPSTIP